MAAASLSRWLGCTEAGMPSAPKRAMSAGSTSWACSTRCIAPATCGSASMTSRTVRTAASPMAWISLAMPASAARAGGLGQLLVAVRTGMPVGPPGGGPGGVVGLVGRQQGRGAAAQGAVGEELQPAVAVAAALVAFDQLAGAEADLDGPLELVLANAGHDAQRQAPGPGHLAVVDRAAAQLRVGRHAAGIMDRGDAQLGERARVGARWPSRRRRRWAPG